MRPSLPAFALLVAFVAAGCAAPAPLAAGSPCFLATDCGVGLVCVPTSKAAGAPRVCSADLGSVAHVPPAPAGTTADAAAPPPPSTDAAPPTEGGAGSADGAAKD